MLGFYLKQLTFLAFVYLNHIYIICVLVFSFFLIFGGIYKSIEVQVHFISFHNLQICFELLSFMLVCIQQFHILDLDIVFCDF